MIKLRAASYCNRKLLLIFLVVYGHLIEPQLWTDPWVYQQYRWIYAVHMPLFAFLTGLFLTHKNRCKAQAVRCFGLYLFLQTVAVCFGSGKVWILTPYWVLWYLLSTSCWCLLGWLWYGPCRGKAGGLLLAAAIAVGCMAGFAQGVGREHSLSRTLVFFPYFMAGLLCRNRKNWATLRLPALAAAVLGVCIMLTKANRFSPCFFYHATAYTDPSQVFDRLICYGIGFSLGFFLLAWIPQTRLPVTKLGAETMVAYLAQPPFVLMVQKLLLPWPYYVFMAGGYLFLVYLLTHFCQLYGIRR